jgi:hypothetical protein
MLIRRFAASACALCLAVPAAAAAKDGYVGHPRHTVASIPAGDTKYDLPHQQPTHDTPVARQAALQPGSSSGDASGWQLAALAEAALLATVAVGATAAVSGRRDSAPHVGA